MPRTMPRLRPPLLILSVLLIAGCASQPTAEQSTSPTPPSASSVPILTPRTPTPAPSLPPTGRVDAASVWDSTRGQLVIFGGFDGSNSYLNDTWTWAGSWTQHYVAGPSGRRHAAIAFDPVHGVALLYGGDGPCQGNSCQQFHDTWAWDGSAWSKMNPVNQPSIGGVMTYDPTSSSIVLWGFLGQSFPPTDAEMWKWTGSDWNQVDVQRTGSQLLKLDGYQFGLSPDPVTGLVMLVGHIDGTTPNTWDWDGTKWSFIGTVGPAFQFNMQEDVATKTVVAEDGTGTWSWDGKGWSRLAVASGPGKLQEAGMAYDASDGWVLLFGGIDPDTAYGMRNDLWAWDGQVWRQLT